MYPGQHARLRPLQPAFIMAATGETVTYRELDARSNKLAHLFRKHGLKRRDHYSIFMENNSRYLEACGAGERAGLYYTCINSYLTAGELAYLLVNSQSKILITSVAKLDIRSELDARSNKLAHLFRKHGLKRRDHYSIFMENNSRYLEACGAGERAGLYYTCINSYLTAGELAYLLVNSQSKILITSVAKLDI